MQKLLDQIAEQLPAASLAAELLALIPSMEFGAPATNATVPPALAREIEARAAAVERQAARDNAKDPRLSDSWRLIYSNGREITNLATGLPLGFVLGKTYQPVDVQTGRFENQGLVEHRLGHRRRAERLLRRALAHDGDCADAHNRLGALLLEGSRNEESYRHLRRAFELAPEDSATLLHLAQAAARIGKLDEARQHVRAAAQFGASSKLVSAVLRKIEAA